MSGLTNVGTWRAVPCATPGVICIEHQFRSKANSRPRVDRLYVTPNDWRLCARQGGSLVCGDIEEKTWEIVVMTPWGSTYGEPVGFVEETVMLRYVAKLAVWFDDPKAEASRWRNAICSDEVL